MKMNKYGKQFPFIIIIIIIDMHHAIFEVQFSIQTLRIEEDVNCAHTHIEIDVLLRYNKVHCRYVVPAYILCSIAI